MAGGRSLSGPIVPRLGWESAPVRDATSPKGGTDGEEARGPACDRPGPAAVHGARPPRPGLVRAAATRGGPGRRAQPDLDVGARRAPDSRGDPRGDRGPGESLPAAPRSGAAGDPVVSSGLTREGLDRPRDR